MVEKILFSSIGCGYAALGVPCVPWLEIFIGVVCGGVTWEDGGLQSALIWTDLFKHFILKASFLDFLLGGGLAKRLKKTDEQGCFDDVSL